MFVVPVSRRSAHPIDRLFDSGFERFVSSLARTEQTPRSPALDLSEADGHYTAQLDLPGVAKADLKITIDGRRVSIETQAAAAVATAKADAPAQPATEATVAAPAERLVHRERGQATYARSFALPVELDAAASQARLQDGVLVLTLVKRAPTEKRITVA
jgi:HSP20 family protein